MLNQTYGDYFLAELIEAQDETMQCVVAEVRLCGEDSGDLFSLPHTCDLAIKITSFHSRLKAQQWDS